MPARAPDCVLLLRGVVVTLRAGLPGCAASACVLAGVDVSLARGERVEIVDCPDDAGTLLLLVAAGLLRPEVGEVWTAPGARIVVDGSRVERELRGVAERRSSGRPRAVSWPGGRGAAVLALDGASEPSRIPVRRMRFYRGVLRPASPSR
jgi:hypothetical protein